MIVDGARDPRIFWILREFHLEHYCLYSGPLPTALKSAAPYLVQLDYDDKDTRRFLQIAWGKSWGVFLKSGAHANKLKRHLRGFLLARDAAGNRMLFRYYDPRVLRAYLPTCIEEELRNIFGPIACFWTEDSAAQDMLEFRLRRGGLTQRTLPLESGASDRDMAPGSLRDDVAQVEADLRAERLTVRPLQMAVFSELEVRKFEEWMLVHLRRFFPRECRAADEKQLRETIQYGIERAAAYGVNSKRDVCKYIDLMIVFGKNFDTDPRYSWAGQILGEPGDSSAKMRSAVLAAQRHLRKE